tara:strand:+ start:127 stop:1299 length:1173 start_codon:yes stop_codon:yes gene_type:complete
MSYKISVVLTIYGNDGNLYSQLNAIAKQTLLPDEVVIINSHREIMEKKIIKEFENLLDIKYFFYRSRLMPGGARNIGAKQTQNEIIAFLDSKTVPDHNWLKFSISKLINEESKIMFGKTQYKAVTYFNELLILTMYGKKPVSTIPGTVMYKEIFNSTKGFKENVRAGEDLEWRARIKKLGIKSNESSEVNLIYSSLSNNIFQETFRNARNSWSTAKIDAQINTRLLFIGQFLIFILLAAPNWNQYFAGIIFIPNISKITLMFAALVMIIYYLKINLTLRKIISILMIPLIVLLGLLWFFDPELIKILFFHLGEINIALTYLTFLCAGSFIFRSFISPLRLGADFNDIFPLKWIMLGFVGLINDLFKTPGYLLGGFFYLLKLLKRKIKLNV